MSGNQPLDSARSRTQTHFAVVIGSGFSGLGAAIALRKAGIEDFVVLEKAEALGGTWRENTYPGCACDIPSHLYSYSFEPNPRWSETYSTQPEIRAYLERVADKYDVRRHVRFGVEATSADLDEASGTWTVGTRGGDAYRARVVIGGVGPLHRWQLPKIPGLQRFRGKVFHSAGWDPTFEPKGKRVAAVGTGASAIQFVPELAKVTEKLHVFQRTPAWVMPRIERVYGEGEKRALETVPGMTWLYRQRIFLEHELKTIGFLREPKMLALGEKVVKRHIARAIQDPELRKKLTPSYRMGCKRILMSNTYYPALARPNVEVIAGGLESVTETGVVGPDGVERPVDAIAFGTGFDVHDYLGTVRVRGRAGRDLGDEWAREGAQAFMGVTVSGFPNFFTIVGPNSGLGSNSMVFMIEAQIGLVMRFVEEIRKAPGTLVEVKRDVQDAFNEKLQARLRGTIWESGCQAWYHDAKGRNPTIWPGYCTEFALAARKFDRADYRIERAVSRAIATGVEARA